MHRAERADDETRRVEKAHPYSGQKLHFAGEVAAGADQKTQTFGKLGIGDHFINFPLPGDNRGHGGHLKKLFVFVKTKTDVPDMYKNGAADNVQHGIESTFTHSMPILKVSFK